MERKLIKSIINQIINKLKIIIGKFKVASPIKTFLFQYWKTLVDYPSMKLLILDEQKFKVGTKILK
jgi:hypothetical protein